MARYITSKDLGEKFLCAYTAIFLDCLQESIPIKRNRLCLDTLQQLLPLLGQLIEIVDQIDKQKLFGWGTGKPWLNPKIEHAPTQNKAAMTLMIVDNAFTIKLGRTNSQRIIGIGGRQQKMAIPQECLDQNFIFCGTIAKRSLLWAVIQSARQLDQHAVTDQLLDMAGLDDVRIHDLRHSFASGALALGEGLTMIGKLLGHTQVQTTARYAHLANDPVKAAAGKVSDTIGAAMMGK